MVCETNPEDIRLTAAFAYGRVAYPSYEGEFQGAPSFFFLKGGALISLDTRIA